MVTDAFEGFAHALRIMSEAAWRANDLLFVDAHEAAGNIEQALTNVLNACHSVYDCARHETSISFDWYGTPETATVLAVRNARHHNLANRVRGLYTYHLQQPSPEFPKPYVLVDCPETEDGGDTFDSPISWSDLSELLALPKAKNRLQPSVCQSIFSYLDGDTLNSCAQAQNVSPQSVFLNVTPLIVNAAIKSVPHLKPLIKPRSLEGRAFLGLFENVLPADTHNYHFSKISVFLPG